MEKNLAPMIFRLQFLELKHTPIYDLANASPPLQNRSKIQIRKAPSLRPDSGVKNADGDVRTIVRFRLEASLVS
ncbi:hypothetical protein Hanom_Chr04g00339431 [Helianthus anomalus]